MDVSNISQVAKVVETASSLTRGVQSVVNATQPFSASVVSEVLKDSVSLASAFSTNLGSAQVNVPAAASVASNMAGLSGAPLGPESGSISGASSNTSFLDGASTFLSEGTTFGTLNGSGEIAPDVNYFSSDGMSEVMNASFADGASILGGAGGFLGEGGAGGGGLTVENILDPQTIPSDWVFVTAPQDIGWEKQGAISTVDNFGTNSPYVIYSSTGMRKLNLGEALIEGFSAGKEVEDHIIKLESMMDMVMNGEAGYVSPYVWDLRAGDKSYGNFIIESLNIKEVMRNKKGRADRATASITLQQVPDFQINDGRDLATSADLASGKSIVSDSQKKATAGAKGANAPGSKATPGNSGSGKKGGGKDEENKPVGNPEGGVPRVTVADVSPQAAGSG